jgi:hypothetical protein
MNDTRLPTDRRRHQLLDRLLARMEQVRRQDERYVLDSERTFTLMDMIELRHQLAKEQRE